MNIQKYLDLFEYQLRDDKDENSGFWSFKLDAIRIEDAIHADNKYRKMSNVIHNATVSEDCAYTFTVEALQAMDEILEGAKEQEFSDQLDDIEIIEAYSEAPIYNNELLKWVSKGTSNVGHVEDAINDFGWAKESNLMQMIGLGYKKAWEEHYFKVLEAIKD